MRQAPRTAVRLAVVAVVGLLLLLALWAVLPWQWSLVDDPDYRINLLRAQQENGWLGGILERIDAAEGYDRSGGQFRPLLWVYSGTFYLLGPGLAHAARLLMLLVAIGCIGLAVRQRMAGTVDARLRIAMCVWAVAVVVSIRGLFDGLSFLSIMELPTVTFAAAAAVDRSDARRLLWMTLASLCKSPVVGGLFALALVLYRRGRRGLAIGAACTGVVIVLWARDFALGGSYTADYQLSFEHARSTVVGLGRQLALPALVLASSMLWVRTARVQFDGDAFVLLAAGVGYVALLLPWGSSSGYNLAAPAFLLVAGAVLFVSTTVRAKWNAAGSSGHSSGTSPTAAPRPGRAILVTPVVVSVLVAGFVTTVGVNAAFERDATVRGVVDWADGLPAGEVVATNGAESSVRYAQLLALRHGRTASTDLVFAPPGAATPCGVTWVVAMHDQGAPPLGDLELDRSFPLGDVYRVAGSGGQDPAC